MATSKWHMDWPLEAKVFVESDGTRSELENAFSAFGAVKKIWIVKKPPGFALS